MPLLPVAMVINGMWLVWTVPMRWWSSPWICQCLPARVLPIIMKQPARTRRLSGLFLRWRP
jgi:Glycoside hydrolase 97.